MNIRSTMIGVAIPFIAFAGAICTPQLVNASPGSYQTSCQVPEGGGWAYCERKFCNYETNTCTVVEGWWQWMPEAVVQQ